MPAPEPPRAPSAAPPAVPSPDLNPPPPPGPSLEPSPTWTTGALRGLADRLYLEEVEPDVGQSLMKEVRRILPPERWGLEVDVYVTAAAILSQWVKVLGPLEVSKGKLTVVALIGPTGVGKSTTLAKLAALAAFKDKRRVGLITADTQRVAAVEQLKVYARLLNLPLAVVQSRDELEAALQASADLDLVFLDTAGQSPNDLERLRAIKELLLGATRLRTLLVLSATTRASDVRDILRRFDAVGYDALVLTKLDESRSHGIVLNAPHWSGRPLAFLGVGQEVPKDLEEATLERIADLILDLTDQFPTLR